MGFLGMATRREKSIKNILDMFSIFAQKVMLHNAVSFVDINKSAEPLFMSVLNKIYDLDLQSMNAIQINYPAIDLGDASAKICYQVTSVGTNYKYKETVKKFKEKGLDRTYRELRFLIIGESSITSFDQTLRTRVDDLRTLARDVESLPDIVLESLESYLNHQLSDSRLYNSILPATLLAPNNSVAIDSFARYCNATDADEIEYLQKDIEEFLKILRGLNINQREFIYFVAANGHHPNPYGSRKGDTNKLYMTKATLEQSFDLRKVFKIIRSLDDKGLADWDEEYYRYSGENPTEAVSLRFYKYFDGFNLISQIKDFVGDDDKTLREIFIDTDISSLA